MEIIKTIQPGKAGSKNLLNEYGERLVCVRYRVDDEAKKRYTTVELIVNEKPMIDTRVWISLKFDEGSLRKQLMEAGAKWDAQKRLWNLEYQQVILFDLENRIISN